MPPQQEIKTTSRATQNTSRSPPEAVVVPFAFKSITILEECLPSSPCSRAISRFFSVVVIARGDVCDFDFNPFNDEQIISSSADLTVMVSVVRPLSMAALAVPGGRLDGDHHKALAEAGGSSQKGRLRGVQSRRQSHRRLCFRVTLSSPFHCSDGTAKVWDCKYGDEVVSCDCKALP